MEAKIAEILKELYALDPGLRKHEAQLQPAIEQLLLARPDAELDQNFMQGLRVRLQAHIQELSGESNKKSLIFNLNFMSRVSYAAAGLLAAIILIFGSWYLLQTKNSSQNLITDNPGDLASRVNITTLGKEAFGSLAQANTVGRGGGGGAGSSATSPLAAGQAGDSTKTATPVLGIGGGGGGNASAGTMIMPPYQPYKFVYKGEAFTVDQTEMPVYRRVKSLGTAVDAAQSLKNLNFGVLNLSSFRNLDLQSLNLVEDRDFGYAFFINLLEGTVSISQNWQRWGENGKLCGGNVLCSQPVPLRQSDIPDDQTLIKMANDFLAEHNINVSNYGTPVVQNFWRVQYEATSDKSQFYFPEVINVIYPLQISGENVYDEGGNVTGLSVNVDLRYKLVSGVYDLTTLQYESSQYKTETDVARLIKLAEQGNFRNYGYGGGGYPVMDGNPASVEINLGTPKTAYVKLWNYTNGQADELIVPALIFPITNAPQAPYFYQENVVIPLIKEILDKQGNGGPVPLPEAR